LGSMICYVKNAYYKEKFVKCMGLSRGAEL